MGNLACTGRETRLLNCSTSGRFFCNHGEDAGVVCQMRSGDSLVVINGTEIFRLVEGVELETELNIICKIFSLQHNGIL